jgi:hypothetical protein
MPQQPRRLETRRMAEMTQGVEDIKVPCWNRGRPKVLQRFTSRGWCAGSQTQLRDFLATVSHARQAQRIDSEEDCNQ